MGKSTPRNNYSVSIDIRLLVSLYELETTNLLLDAVNVSCLYDYNFLLYIQHFAFNDRFLEHKIGIINGVIMI